MATVTLPGSGKAYIGLTAGADDSVALKAAIKAEFTAATKSITATTVASGARATAGFFNLVYENEAKKVSATAGVNVQAIIDTGKGVDTLIGGSSTNLIVANAMGDSISTNLSAATATVFGGAGNDTVDVGGKAVLYLEDGKNVVNLNGGDSVSLAGTGGTDTVNITAGNNTVSTAYAATVNVAARGGNESLALASGSMASISGANDTVNITGSGAVVRASGDGDSVNAKGISTVVLNGAKVTETLTLMDGSSVSVSGASVTATISGASQTIDLMGSSENVTLSNVGTGDTVKVTAGTGDLITGTGAVKVSISAATSNDTLSFSGASNVTLGTSDTLNLTGKGAATVTASGSATVIGGSGNLTYVGAANARDSVVAGTGGGSLTAGKGATVLFAAGNSTAGVVFNHGIGGSDTFIGGAHADTMFGAGTDKTHTDMFVFESTLKGGVHTINAFTSGKDTIDLVGYTKAELVSAIAAGAKTFVAKTGTETITLSDHTKITITGLHAALTTKDVI